MILTSSGNLKSSNFSNSFFKCNFFVRLAFCFFLSLFLNQLFDNSINAQWGGSPLDLSGRTDLLPGFGSGIGGEFTNEGGGVAMTEEEYKAAIEAYIEENAGVDLSDADFIAGLYEYLGISSAPPDVSTPEYAEAVSALRSGDSAIVSGLAADIAAAASKEATAETNPEANVDANANANASTETNSETNSRPNTETNSENQTAEANPEIAADALTVDPAAKSDNQSNKSVVFFDEDLSAQAPINEGNQTRSEAVTPNASFDNNSAPIEGNVTQPEVEIAQKPDIVYLGNKNKPDTIVLGNKEKPETVKLGNQTQPETVRLGNEEKPETIYLGNEEKPETVRLGNQTKPDTIILGNQTKPDTIILGNQTQPETIELGNQTQPETVELGNQTQPEALCAGNNCAANASNSTAANTEISADISNNNPDNNPNNNSNNDNEDNDDSYDDRIVATNYTSQNTNAPSAAPVADNPYSLQTATLAVQVANETNDAPALEGEREPVSETVILPAADAELAAFLKTMAVDLKLKTANAQSVLFYIRKGITAAPLYLGRGTQTSAGVWEYAVDLNVNPLPNGNYYIFAQINRGDSKIYRSTDVYIAISIAPPENKEQKEAMEKIMAENVVSIEESEKNIYSSVEQTAAAPSFQKPDMEAKMTELAQLVRIFQRLDNLFEEKTAQKEIGAAQVARLNGEIANLPVGTAELILSDKIRARQYFAEQNKILEKEITVIRAGMEKTTQDIDTLIDEILSFAQNDAERQLMETQIIKMRQEVILGEKGIIESRKILLRDTDGDGLADGREIELGTSLLNPDTDGDGLLDGDEVANGRDPLVPDEIVIDPNIDVSATTPVKSDLYTVDKVAAVKLPGSGDVAIVLSGRGLPLSYVKLFIYSQPVIVAVKTDEYGQWTYTLDKPLDDGQHTVYATLVNSQGRIAARSEVYIFKKTGDQVERVIAGQEASVSSAMSKIMENFKFIIISVVVIAVTAALAAIGFFANRGKKA